MKRSDFVKSAEGSVFCPVCAGHWFIFLLGFIGSMESVLVCLL